MKTSCPPREVPSGRVVHPASVRDHHRRAMSVVSEWHFGRTIAHRASLFTSQIVSTVAVCHISSDRGANNCCKHCILNESNWPFKARSSDSSGGAIWVFLSRRRCDGKLVSEISSTYSVKLISNPLHVQVCLS